MFVLLAQTDPGYCMVYKKIPILNLSDSCHLANGNHLELTFQTKSDIYIITNFKNINIRARKIELEC